MELHEAKEAFKLLTHNALTEHYKENPRLLVVSNRESIRTGKRMSSTDGKTLADFREDEVKLVACTDRTGFGKSAATFEAKSDEFIYTFHFASEITLLEIIMGDVMGFTD